MATSLVLAVLIVLAVYAAVVAAVAAAGRGTDARALAWLVPDCVRLARRLIGDPRVPIRHKLALGGLVAYFAMPFDLVPDFIPVVGYLDDAVLVALTLRWLVRGVGPDLVRTHWGGTPRGLEIVLRFAYSPGGWRTT